tara:strand:+ start:409 stop:633 length:225 start_codon:yes stop_codon:yes gene_type:complete
VGWGNESAACKQAIAGLAAIHLIFQTKKETLFISIELMTEFFEYFINNRFIEYNKHFPVMPILAILKKNNSNIL